MIKKMKGKAWAPGHITGFFEVYIKDDLINSGSRGAGINVNKGVKATAEVIESSNDKVKAPGISRYAIENLIKDLDKDFEIKIEFEKKIPERCGFGCSGAEAITSLLAVKDALGLHLTQNQIVGIAHRIEVKKRTGLGDVVPQTQGGVVIRKKEGGPTVSEIDRIPVKEKELFFYVFGPIETSEVISSEKKVTKINKAGREKRKKLLEEPSLENLFECSREFALETKLGNEETLMFLRETEKKAALTMLGDSVVSLEPIDELEPKKSFKAKISNEGLRIL
ncbi:GHMP kinase [archaeon SCG-AAA382B04]|nr:GHMP kinase [archaeon SCG-AAA382B04]